MTTVGRIYRIELVHINSLPPPLAYRAPHLTQTTPSVSDNAGRLAEFSFLMDKGRSKINHAQKKKMWGRIMGEGGRRIRGNSCAKKYRNHRSDWSPHTVTQNLLKKRATCREKLESASRTAGAAAVRPSTTLTTHTYAPIVHSTRYRIRAMPAVPIDYSNPEMILLLYSRDPTFLG